MIQHEYTANGLDELIRRGWNKSNMDGHLYHNEIGRFTLVSTSGDYDKMYKWVGDSEEQYEGDFYLALDAVLKFGTAQVTIADASAGKYNGAMKNILQEIYDDMLTRDPSAIKSLVVKGDASSGAWEHIAKRLGAQYVGLDY